jgi:hypothetical protein
MASSVITTVTAHIKAEGSCENPAIWMALMEKCSHNATANTKCALRHHEFPDCDCAQLREFKDREGNAMCDS